MPANTQPIFPLTPNIGRTNGITSANTAKDGTGTVNLAFTAGANGSYVEKIVFKPLGTNIQTVARVFLNNGSDPTTATNNIYYDELTLNATTNSENNAIATYVLPMDIRIPASWRIYVTIGTTISAGVQASCYGGDY